MTATLTKLSAKEVEARLQSGRAVLVDIREPDEFARSHVAGAHSQPLSGLEQSHLTVDPDADVVFTCRTGMRNRIAVRFVYEWRDAGGQWWRSHGNENWLFAPSGHMDRRMASINDQPIEKRERLFRWPQGPRPADHPGLTELGL